MRTNLYKTFLLASVLAWTCPGVASADENPSQLDCATTVFSQPGVKFMHKIRATNAQATLSVSGLPKGLTWNATRRVVEGVPQKSGRYTYQIHVTEHGKTTSEKVTFDVSDQLQHPIPFMGWLSWNAVESEVSESIVKRVADLFTEKNLTNYGWNAVMMDDWWHAKSRAADGRPLPDPQRFPNGLTPVSDYVHGKGMRFGIYTDAAEYTCAGAFGSFGKEQIDADAYARWKVDIVKCDYCNAPSERDTAFIRYRAMADALEKAGYGTMLYICEWGEREPWKWGAEAGGRCWRISQDVRDCWTGAGNGEGLLQSIRDMKNISAYQGVNRFNDADMLCTGLHGTGKSSSMLCGGKGPGMTQDEYRSQFALWCMWSSPMALSFDPRKELQADDEAILKSGEVIALNQDAMGQQADLISEADSLVVFAKDCENGDVALSVTNISEKAKTAVFDFSKVPGLDVQKTYVVRDLWAEQQLCDAKGTLSAEVRSHATRVFRLAEKKNGVKAVSPLSVPGFSVAASKGKLVVAMPGTEKLSKRILVMDLSGHVKKIMTTTGVNVKTKLPAGNYYVDVACNAQVVRTKVVM